jgi:hypothetical protein
MTPARRSQFSQSSFEKQTIYLSAVLHILNNDLINGFQPSSRSSSKSWCWTVCPWIFAPERRSEPLITVKEDKRNKVEAKLYIEGNEAILY